MIETDRLILRQWRDQDRQPFAEMNANPEVMRYFLAVRSKQESDASVARFSQSIEQDGWGLWAAVLVQSGDFIGFIGLSSVQSGLPFAPGVEIGWRLSNAFWRKGYATEGARAALKFAFEQTELDEIVSMTAVPNLPSIGVMCKIGMTDCRQNFIHPEVPAGHQLAEHVLYKITKAEWQTHTDS